MAVMTCDRCGDRIAKRVECTYCSKWVCYHCVKSSKRAYGHDIIHICKDCWTDIPIRRRFKQATRKE